MTPALLEELAMVFLIESQNVGGDPYAWPPGPPITAEDRREGERLRTTSSRIYYRAHEGG